MADRVGHETRQQDERARRAAELQAKWDAEEPATEESKTPAA